MKTSADNRFDELFKERFQGFSENPPASVLEKIKTTTAGIKNPIPFWKKGGFFATVGIIIISGITILLINSFSNKKIEIETKNNAETTNSIINTFSDTHDETEESNNNLIAANTGNNLLIKNTSILAKEEIVPSNSDLIPEVDKNEIEQKNQPIVNTETIPTDEQEIIISSRITPATCRKANGKVILSANLEKVKFFWMDIDNEVSHPIMENLHSGTYNIKAITLSGNINNFQVVVPDSSVLRANFTHYSMSDAIGVPVYFYNKSTLDGKSTKDLESISYRWYFGDGSTSSEYEPEHQYNSLGPFNLALVTVNSIGCKDSVNLLPLYITGSSIEACNIFTPNGDGINDVFKPAANGLKNFHCIIFNSNGKEIFELKDPTQGWDGKINHGTQLASEGTYFYIMRGIGIDGKDIIIKNFVTLSLK